jgi:hypothetical protein
LTYFKRFPNHQMVNLLIADLLATGQFPN